MNDKDLEQEIRRQRALDRLGTDNPRCAICGETDWRVLELHHIAGKAYDECRVIHCRNCHRKQEATKDHPAQIDPVPSLEERIAHFLYGLAQLFEQLISKMREFADQLIEIVRNRTAGDVK